MFREFKYLFAYTLPLTAALALYYLGWVTWLPIITGFVLIPFLEQLMPKRQDNVEAEQEDTVSARPFFDILLYLHVPVLFALILFYLWRVTNTPLTVSEIAGLTASLGLMVGTMGINIGHELGHREKKSEQLMALALLMTALYQHFYVEHNRGHHKNVATPKDPATARRNENLYAFWWRSLSQCYLGAWHLETERLERTSQKTFSWQNAMVRYSIWQALYLGVITVAFGPTGLLAALAIALFGALLLETINYIEHYGLKRKQLTSGRYEPVLPAHSWNSNHELGRIMLFELTRHADHHYKATRKFQVLRHIDESPQLPAGYPGCMLMALVPPLWFSVMGQKADAWNELRATA